MEGKTRLWAVRECFAAGEDYSYSLIGVFSCKRLAQQCVEKMLKADKQKPAKPYSPSDFPRSFEIDDYYLNVVYDRCSVGA